MEGIGGPPRWATTRFQNERMINTRTFLPSISCRALVVGMSSGLSGVSAGSGIATGGGKYAKTSLAKARSSALLLGWRASRCITACLLVENAFTNTSTR